MAFWFNRNFGKPNAALHLPLEAEARHERRLEAVRCKRLILIEAPSSAYHRGMLVVGAWSRRRGGDLLRFYNKQHPFYGGLDLHARTMDVCLRDQHGALLLHRNMPASPETLLKAMAPYRDDLGVAVECLCPWYGLADLWPREGRAFVLGQALSMQAMPGGKATNDQIDSQQIAVRLRGGMLPQA